MSPLVQALERSAIARWGCGASVVVVLAAGLVTAGTLPTDRARPRAVPPTSLVARASVAPQATAVTTLTTTTPARVPSSTVAPRATPPFQVVPDDPSATVPPPVRGIDPISGD